MGYVFFDCETTGLKKPFDQIVHFAAIQTDHNLIELGRFEVRARLQPHVVPHPGAISAHRISIAELTDATLGSHYELITAIRRQFIAWSPSIFVGYNSIDFDEHMLRHGLFQSLFPAYLTSQNGNGRADAYGLVQTANALTPGCITVPRKAKGGLSFKLDQLAPANGIGHAGAHNAMSDALAVLGLCRLIKAKSEAAWQRFVRFSNRASVREFVEDESGFVLTEFYAGEPSHRVVACVGSIPNNPNGRFCLDLSAAPERWRVMNDTAIQAEISRKGTPMRRLRINGAPTLSSLDEATEEMLGGLSPLIAEARASELKGDRALCHRIIGLYTASWGELATSPHFEERLYSDGFPNRNDEYRMFEFHEAAGTARIRIAESFEDRRLNAFARRLIHYEHRSLLDAAFLGAADVSLARRLLEDSGGPLTLPQALFETEQRLVDSVGDVGALLRDYRDHLKVRIGRVLAFQAASAQSLWVRTHPQPEATNRQFPDKSSSFGAQRLVTIDCS